MTESMNPKRPKQSYQEWRKKGKHLPKCMRDFHDQKEIFKMIHELTAPPQGQSERVDCMDGHIYAIDTFLWCMARHGYTLQKSQANVAFDDLDKNLEYIRKTRNNAFSSMLKNNKKDPSEP